MVQRQWLMASITSEVGTFGDTRSSLCAVQREGARFSLRKEATTGSYCAHADVIVATARRDAEAGASDQVLVLLRDLASQLPPPGTPADAGTVWNHIVGRLTQAALGAYQCRGSQAFEQEFVFNIQ